MFFGAILLKQAEEHALLEQIILSPLTCYS